MIESSKPHQWCIIVDLGNAGDLRITEQSKIGSSLLCVLNLEVKHLNLSRWLKKCHCGLSK